MTKSAISGQNSRIGTGIESEYRYLWIETKWYRYQNLVALVPAYRKGLVLVPTKVVPVPMLSTTLIFLSVHC